MFSTRSIGLGIGIIISIVLVALLHSPENEPDDVAVGFIAQHAGVTESVGDWPASITEGPIYLEGSEVKWYKIVDLHPGTMNYVRPAYEKWATSDSTYASGEKVVYSKKMLNQFGEGMANARPTAFCMRVITGKCKPDYAGY